jgi:hypothetical protein
MNTYVATCTNPVRCIGKYIVKAPNIIKAGNKASEYLTDKFKVKSSEVLMFTIDYANEIS